MSVFRFFDLPTEIHDHILAYYAEHVRFGFRLAENPLDPSGGFKHASLLRYKWYLSTSETLNHTIPALLLASKSVYKRILTYLGTHHHLHLPHYSFSLRPAELAADINAQLPYWLSQALRQITITPVLDRVQYGNLLHQNEEIKGASRGYTFQAPHKDPIKSLGTIFPLLRQVHLQGRIFLPCWHSGTPTVLDNVTGGEEGTSSASASDIARQQLARATQDWSHQHQTGPTANVLLMSDLQFILEHETCSCYDRPIKTEWVR